QRGGRGMAPRRSSDGEFNLRKEYAMKTGKGVLAALVAAGVAGAAPAQAQVSYKDMADALHAVMESDRTVYTRMVVNRLQNEEKVIKASEHFKDDKALPLPAQMFRFGAEMVAEKKM